MASVTRTHEQRVKEELAKVGVTLYGRGKLTSRYLPQVLYDHEHIYGAVHGWCANGNAMLVATQERIIYLLRRPLFTSTDEISYAVVIGVRRETKGMFDSIELHTRMGDYTLHYVNPKCARIFTEFIEKQFQPATYEVDAGLAPAQTPEITQPALSQPVRKFLLEHGVGVLSTSNRTGEIRGAAVYYVLNDNLHILTKAGTAKAHHMLDNSTVAMTVFDEIELRTAQIQGRASIETDENKKFQVYSALSHARDYGGQILLPPVTQLSTGEFIVFRIDPTHVDYHDYKAPSTA